MEVRDTRDGHYTFEITASELFICRAALREVLYGFKFPDFEPRMGCTREMAASVLNSLPDPPSGEVDRTVPQ